MGNKSQSIIVKATRLNCMDRGSVKMTIGRVVVFVFVNTSRLCIVKSTGSSHRKTGRVGGTVSMNFIRCIVHVLRHISIARETCMYCWNHGRVDNNFTKSVESIVNNVKRTITSSESGAAESVGAKLVRGLRLYCWNGGWEYRQHREQGLQNYNNDGIIPYKGIIPYYTIRWYYTILYDTRGASIAVV